MPLTLHFRKLSAAQFRSPATRILFHGDSARGICVRRPRIHFAEPFASATRSRVFCHQSFTSRHRMCHCPRASMLRQDDRHRAYPLRRQCGAMQIYRLPLSSAMARMLAPLALSSLISTSYGASFDWNGLPRVTTSSLIVSILYQFLRPNCRPPQFRLNREHSYTS